MVGPIPIDDGNGKEPISRFTTDLNSQDIFYTDSNGRELIKRKLNYRPTWDVTLDEPVAGNYYPITSMIIIRDEDKGVEVAVLNDRAQGGSSLTSGQLEIMVHRRLLHDDSFGVGEALNETQYDHGLIARGRHYIIAGSSYGSNDITLAAQERILAQKILWQPWVFINPTDITDVQQQDILSSVSITSVKETTLAANQWLSDMKRLTWTSTDTEQTNPTVHEDDDEFNVTLSPMQIRTFVVTF